MSEALDGLEQAQRQELGDKLKLCTHENRVFFKRIFPDGVTADKLESAIALVDRTIVRHNRDQDHE
jgi:hypothetical protein